MFLNVHSDKFLQYLIVNSIEDIKALHEELISSGARHIQLPSDHRNEISSRLATSVANSTSVISALIVDS